MESFFQFFYTSLERVRWKTGFSNITDHLKIQFARSPLQPPYTFFNVFSDSAEARCLPDAETSQEVVLSAMERYCKNRFPDETFRFGKILLKLMGLRAVNANDLEFLFFSKILHHSSVAAVIRNQLVSDMPSPVSSYKETSYSPVNKHWKLVNRLLKENSTITQGLICTQHQPSR